MVYNVTLEAPGNPTTRKIEQLEATNILEAWSIALDTYYKPSDHPDFTPYQIVGIDIPQDEAQRLTAFPLFPAQ